MGYPPKFVIPVSDTQAYRQFGNSVVVPVVERIAAKVVECLAADSGRPDRNRAVRASGRPAILTTNGSLFPYATT
jgi:uncharacterized protein YbaA (DUF1428 family)